MSKMDKFQAIADKISEKMQEKFVVRRVNGFYYLLNYNIHHNETFYGRFANVGYPCGKFEAFLNGLLVGIDC